MNKISRRRSAPSPIDAAVAALVRAHIDAIRQIDVDDKTRWQEVVTLAVDGGLKREQLAIAFSCNVLTIDRWSSGKNAPTAMTRKAIKAELITSLEEIERSFLNGIAKSHHLEVEKADAA